MLLGFYAFSRLFQRTHIQLISQLLVLLILMLLIIHLVLRFLQIVLYKYHIWPRFAGIEKDPSHMTSLFP